MSRLACVVRGDRLTVSPHSFHRDQTKKLEFQKTGTRAFLISKDGAVLPLPHVKHNLR